MTGWTSPPWAPGRWPASRCPSTRTGSPPSSASGRGSRTRSTPCRTATSWPRPCSTWPSSASTSRASARSWCSGRPRSSASPAGRRLRHRELDAAAEEEPRRRRARPGQGRPAHRQPHRPAGHAQGPAALLQPGPPRGQGAPLRLARPDPSGPRGAGRPARLGRPSTPTACRRRPTAPSWPPWTWPNGSSSVGCPSARRTPWSGAWCATRSSVMSRWPSWSRPTQPSGRPPSRCSNPACRSPGARRLAVPGPKPVKAQLARFLGQLEGDRDRIPDGG